MIDKSWRVGKNLVFPSTCLVSFCNVSYSLALWASRLMNCHAYEAKDLEESAFESWQACLERFSELYRIHEVYGS